MEIEFISSHGMLCTDEKGFVIEEKSDREDWLANIARVDVEELQHYNNLNNFGALDFGDVLEFGFWNKKGEYIAPEMEHRKKVFHNNEMDIDKVIEQSIEWLKVNRNMELDKNNIGLKFSSTSNEQLVDIINESNKTSCDIEKAELARRGVKTEINSENKLAIVYPIGACLQVDKVDIDPSSINIFISPELKSILSAAIKDVLVDDAIEGRLEGDMNAYDEDSLMDRALQEICDSEFYKRNLLISQARRNAHMFLLEDEDEGLDIDTQLGYLYAYKGGRMPVSFSNFLIPVERFEGMDIYDLKNSIFTFHIPTDNKAKG